MLSPIYSLDQTDTYKAIDKLQAFIDTYPNSEYLSEANETVRVLQEKIEKKYLKTRIQYNIRFQVGVSRFR
jgi:outer membrane protein assembly factor BamD